MGFQGSYQDPKPRARKGQESIRGASCNVGCFSDIGGSSFSGVDLERTKMLRTIENWKIYSISHKTSANLNYYNVTLVFPTNTTMAVKL